LALSHSLNGSGILQRGLFKKASRCAQASDTRLVLSTFRDRHLVQFTVFLVAYCIAGKLGQATTNIRSSNLGPVWPAYGIALAAFLVCGYRVWPAIALGAFLIAFFSPVTHLAALGQAAGATLAAFSGAFLLQHVANFDKSLSRLRDGLALVVLGALGSALVSASIGTSVLYATQVHAYSGLGSAWLIYWLGDATGVLLVTPVALTLPGFLRIRDQARITELAVLFVLLTAACFLIFGDPGLIPVRLHVLAFAVLPFVMWAAVRFGVTGAGLSVLLIATIATVETALGSGPFAASTPFTNAVLLDAFFAVLSVTGITLASVIGEREQAQREREQSVREQGALEARLEAEQVVHASEERLRLAQQAARMGTFEWNIRTGVNTWTPELETMYGLPVGGFGGTQQAFENLVHRDDLAGVVELVNSAFKTGEPTAGEWRVVWPDGSVHWIAGRWQVFMNESGEPLRMVGVNMDVTERKLAEEAVAGMSRKLIKAQEQERTRIGRELHDDINQRLAMLAVELEQLQANPSEVQTRLQELRKQATELSDDVQALSHEFHSSKLEYLGVVAGIKSWCKEFGERQAMEIDFKSDVSSVVPFDVGICLFRVLQESLHNAAKHSAVKRLEVQLREVSNEIHLIVTDLGRGFDVEAAIQSQGLGLTSMQERVRLLNGSVDIESKPMAGTTIHVCVPFG
jgi:PAS domain S-box-containing protein